MERKKRSKGMGWESCYVKKIYGTFGVEMRAYGQKLVKFCKHTDTQTHASKLVAEILTVCCNMFVLHTRVKTNTFFNRCAQYKIRLNPAFISRLPLYYISSDKKTMGNVCI